MQTGDVIFFRSEDTFISKLIAKLTKFPYTHVALAINSEEVIEANRFINTRVVKLELDNTLHKVYRLPDLTPEKRWKIRDRALVYTDYPYDNWQIFSWFLQIVLGTERTFFNRANKLICSELIDYAFIGAGIERKKDDRIGDITPAMLLDYYDLREVEEHGD